MSRYLYDSGLLEEPSALRSASVLAKEVFDGVMVSDGFLFRPRSLTANSYFSMMLSGSEHIDWLLSTKETLCGLRIEFPPEYPYVFSVVKRGKLYDYCFLRSYVSPYLTQQRKRWYPNGVKEVPEDFTLTPVSLACMFMGDGNSSLDRRNPIPVHARLCTQGFSLRSVGLIEIALRKIGIVDVGHEHHKKVGKGAGMGLSILQDSVNRFMKMVEPHMEPSYMYKVKYRGSN